MGRLAEQRAKLNFDRPSYGAEADDNAAFQRLQGVADQGLALGMDARGQQQAAYDQYAGLASGQGPSLAQAQLQQATDRGIAATQAAMAQGRGGNLAAMASQAVNAGAAQQMAANQQAAMLRAQEQQAALAGMAGLAGQMRSQDQSLGLAYEQGLQNALGQQYSGDMQYGLAQQQMEMERRRQNKQLASDITGAALGAIGGAAGALA